MAVFYSTERIIQGDYYICLNLSDDEEKLPLYEKVLFTLVHWNKNYSLSHQSIIVFVK